MITIDFETEAIVGNPILNPPKPVGVAVWVEGQEPVYLSWGHPGENNCDWGTAHKYLTTLRDSGEPLLFHNAGFDLSVWNYYFCNAVVNVGENWKRIHDTVYLLFLADPYSSTLSLKPSADRYLGMPATEQDVLQDWILANVPAATAKNFGAYISLAPAELVRPYAIGDVVRTRKLFDLLKAQIDKDGMEAAYDRERRIFPVLLNGTQRGIRIDRDTLDHHTGVYTTCLQMAKDRAVDILGGNHSVWDSDNAMADALEASGAVKEWVLTPTGKRSMAKGNIKIVHPELKQLMEYHNALETCLSVFMRPWLDFSSVDGRLHPNWNQVRTRGDLRDSGTRTGRLSSDSPNFQNVPTEFSKIIAPDGLHPLPTLRAYCLPEEGHVWLKRDFSSQEIRILAHFEDGALCEAYRADPGLDPHQMAMDLIKAITGILFERKDVKITGFSILYGSGVTSLAAQLGRPYDEAQVLKTAYLDAMPGVRELMQDVQRRGRQGQAIRTWGGRLYYAEPPREIDGRMRDFAYKLLNYLIQGSAADQTKQSICDWADTRVWSDIFLATVHDEINISAPVEDIGGAMQRLRDAMNKDRFDVPFLSEGFKGANWHELESFEA